MSEPILYEVRDHAAWITLNLPEKHNALSRELCEGLAARLADAEADPTVRMVLLGAVGRSFCAGADLKGAGGGAVQPGAEEDPPFVQALKRLWHMPKPVIGRIHANAYGGGLGLVAACDIALVAESVHFAFTEVRLGVIPAIVAVLVMRKMGLADATELFLTGERFDAARAAELKLVTRAVPEAELDAAVEAVRGQLLQAGPIALSECKRLLRAVPEMDVDEGLAWTHAKSRSLFESEEGREGMAAFAEKRKPRWAP